MIRPDVPQSFPSAVRAGVRARAGSEADVVSATTALGLTFRG